MLVDPKTDNVQKIAIPSSFLGSLSAAESKDKFVLAAVAGSPTSPSFITSLTLKSVSDLPSSKKEQWQTLRRSSTETVCLLAHTFPLDLIMSSFREQKTHQNLLCKWGVKGS